MVAAATTRQSSMLCFNNSIIGVIFSYASDVTLILMHDRTMFTLEGTKQVSLSYSCSQTPVADNFTSMLSEGKYSLIDML